MDRAGSHRLEELGIISTFYTPPSGIVCLDPTELFAIVILH